MSQQESVDSARSPESSIARTSKWNLTAEGLEKLEAQIRQKQKDAIACAPEITLHGNRLLIRIPDEPEEQKVGSIVIPKVSVDADGRVQNVRVNPHYGFIVGLGRDLKDPRFTLGEYVEWNRFNVGTRITAINEHYAIQDADFMLMTHTDPVIIAQYEGIVAAQDWFDR